MALIRNAVKTSSNVLKDLWKECFYLDSIPQDKLVIRALKRVGKSTQNNGDDEFITNGSTVIVSPGQCAMIVDKGRIVDICDEPGEYTYNTKEKPSLWVSDAIKTAFSESTRRFTYGSDTATSQRVYFINMKEILGIPFGTSNPVLFRVVDNRAGIDMDIRLRLCGSFTFKITNPVTLFEFVTGNVADSYNTADIIKQLKHEVISVMNPALAEIGNNGIRYTELFLHSDDIENCCRALLTDLWENSRGVQLCNLTFDSITPVEEDIATIQRLQRGATFVDERLAQANLMDAQMDALRNASSNSAGAMTGFVGLNMASNSIQGMAAPSRTVPQNRTIPNTMSGQWVCSCGKSWDNAFGFCPICGSQRK